MPERRKVCQDVGILPFVGKGSHCKQALELGSRMANTVL